jgi:general secretion pathway protein D
MTVKNPFFVLFLTGFGLWAEPAPSPAPPPSAPPLPTAELKATVNTNREEELNRALQVALEKGTNAPAASVVGRAVETGAGAPATGATSSVAVTGTNAPVPDIVSGPLPKGTNTPAAGMAGGPAKSAPGADASAPSSAVGAQPRARSLARPDAGSAPAFPAASVKPATGPAAPSTTKAAPADLSAAAAKSSDEETIEPGMIDFRQADLDQVLDIYSLLVNRTILRPSTLPSPPIKLTTKTLLTKKEAIQALDAVLALNGIAMVNVGEKFVKAMPEATANTAGAGFDTNRASALPEMGQYLTHVVPLKYAKPSEMVPILQPFSKIPTSVLPIEGTQMLVLRDYAENVKRMLELIAQVDVAVPSEFVSEVIPIKYAKASDIASALNSLSTGGGATTVGGTGAGGGTRGTRSSGFGRTGTTTGSGYPGQMTPGMVTPVGGAGTPTPAAGSSFSQRLQNIIQRAAGPGTGEIQVIGQTKIISDERTNSLLIYASKEDMKTIKEIVAKLDIVLAQVLIEAAVISVTLTDSRDLGFSYIEQQSHGIGNYFKGLGAINNGNSLSQSPLVGATTNVATLPSGFSYLASFGQDLDVTLTALQADSRARILQRPRIQTSHNEPASIFVGQSRPYPTSSYYGGGAYGGYSSIQQLQIGVTLEVTPLINPDGLVVMDIHTKIDSFDGNVTIENVGDVPITSDKEAQAKVSVRDHDTIILGGLIETDQNKNNSGVPFLMDIPLLGYLFRSSHKDQTRSELVVLIRPTVLPTPEIAALTATAEKNRMPGVRATEKDIHAEELRWLKEEGKTDRSGKTDQAVPSQPVQNP